MPRPRRRNPWVATGEVLLWILFALLLVPAGFAGWAVGHYTSLGGSKSAAPRTVTVTAPASTAPASTAAATTTAAGATTASGATTAAGATTTAAAAGDAAAGKSVFASVGCAGCHTFKPAGASGTVGPDLDAAPEQDAQKAGMELAAFVHESIVDPDAYIAPGFPKGVMPTTYKSQLSQTQLDDLVAFIVSGSK